MVLSGTGLLMLAFAAGSVLGSHARLLSALVLKFTLGLQPVVHGSAFGAAFALKNLVRAGGDIIALEDLTVAFVITDAVAVTI